MPDSLVDDAVAYLRQNGRPIRTETLREAQDILVANPSIRPSYVREGGNTQASMMANMGAPSAQLPGVVDTEMQLSGFDGPRTPVDMNIVRQAQALAAVDRERERGVGTQPLPETDAYFNKPPGQFESDLRTPYSTGPLAGMQYDGAGTPVPGMMQPVAKPSLPQAASATTRTPLSNAATARQAASTTRTAPGVPTARPTPSVPMMKPPPPGANAPEVIPTPTAPVENRVEPSIGGDSAEGDESGGYLSKIGIGLASVGALLGGARLLRGSASPGTTSTMRPRGAGGIGIGQGATGTAVDSAGLTGDIIPPNQKQLAPPRVASRPSNGTPKLIGSSGVVDTTPQRPTSNAIGEQTQRGVPVGKAKSKAPDVINQGADKRKMLENMTGKDKPRVKAKRKARGRKAKAS